MKLKDLKIELVKRDTDDLEPNRVPPVRITHKPTGKSVTIDYGKSVEQNRDRAMELLKSILGE